MWWIYIQNMTNWGIVCVWPLACVARSSETRCTLLVTWCAFKSSLIGQWNHILSSDWFLQSTQPYLEVTLATPVPGYSAQLNIDNRPASLNMLELSLTQYHVSAPCACQSFIEKKNILLIFCCVGNSLVCLIIFVQSAQWLICQKLVFKHRHWSKHAYHVNLSQFSEFVFLWEREMK